ncbi:hypothetical protein KI387_044651, partial [Taxus chinensis]
VDANIHILKKTYVWPNKEAYVETMDMDNIDITPKTLAVGKIDPARVYVYLIPHFKDEKVLAREDLAFS